MNTNTFLPRIIERFFGVGRPPREMPEGYVYFGPDTNTGFKSIPWSTKIKGGEYKNREEESKRASGVRSIKHYHVFVSIEQVVSFALGPDSYTTIAQKEEILAYAKRAGIQIVDCPDFKSQEKDVPETIVETTPVEEVVPEEKPLPVEKPKKPRKSRRIIKVEKPVEKLFEGEILRTVTLILEEPILVSSYLGNEKVEVEPGEIILAEIESPLKLEYIDADDKKKHTWWVLRDKLPKIFGRSVTNWYQIFGRDPFSVSSNDPPAQ